MRKFVLVIACTIVAMMAMPVGAAEVKIGVVNVNKLVGESPQAQRIQEQLEQEFASDRRDILGQQNDLKELQEKFQRDAQVMSESERSNMDRRIRSMERDLQFRQQSFMEDVQARRNQELGKLQRELGQAVEAFAKAEGYDLILTEGVAYVGEAFDVTDEVLERINQ